MFKLTYDDKVITIKDKLWWEYFLSKLVSFFISVKVWTLIFIGVLIYILIDHQYNQYLFLLETKKISDTVFQYLVSNLMDNIRYIIIGVVGVFFIAKEGFKVASLFKNGHVLDLNKKNNKNENLNRSNNILIESDIKEDF